MKNQDVIIYDVDYCLDCGFERPVSDIGTKEGRKCPKCGKFLFKTTRVEKI